MSTQDISPQVKTYLQRIGADVSFISQSPTSFQSLKEIIRNHLATVPFENLDLHKTGGKISLSMNDIYEKVVHRNRGGFCFELNGLMGSMLRDLGYRVRYVTASVYHEPEFLEHETHIFLLVSGISDFHSDEVYFADVGFGEPSMEPLRYIVTEKPQVTSEGMQSRFQRCEDDDRMMLEWKKEDGSWEPRLRWSNIDPLGEGGPNLHDLQPNCDIIINGSIFTEKLILVKITGQYKKTLAGSKFKITKPRFGGEKHEIHLQSPEEEKQEEEEKKKKYEQYQQLKTKIRKIMQEEFGICMKESEGLDLSPSLMADPVIWGHM